MKNAKNRPIRCDVTKGTIPDSSSNILLHDMCLKIEPRDYKMKGNYGCKRITKAKFFNVYTYFYISVLAKRILYSIYANFDLKYEHIILN